jgi:ubiquinone/menaquinone biosynthesis C-methylase UbiE
MKNSSLTKITAPKIIQFVRNLLLLRIIDKVVVRIKMLNNPKDTFAMDVPSHTVNENKRLWNRYDWSIGAGEEWTGYAQTYKGLDPNTWKTSLINEMMLKYIKNRSTILEIGPGAGRWTEILQKLANRLILADISERALSLCRERFRGLENIEYHLIEGKLDFIDDNVIDFIWAYDVFVHINPTDIEKYIIDFKRILRRGGCAIIHHADKYSDEKFAREKALRSYMNARLFAEIVKKDQMEMVEQNYDLVHIPGDVISVFRKPL